MPGVEGGSFVAAHAYTICVEQRRQTLLVSPSITGMFGANASRQTLLVSPSITGMFGANASQLLFTSNLAVVLAAGAA
jgi:hypothetical protein